MVYPIRTPKKDTFGLTDYESLEITIAPNLCGENKKRTVIHEIIHAYCYSIGYCNKNKYDSEELCEFVAHNLETIKKLSDEALEELK